jgi:ferredoxin
VSASHRDVIARLELDGARCDGHGICSLVCPERIQLDQWGYAQVDSTPIDRPVQLRRARRAVSACPAAALHLVEVEARRSPARGVRDDGHVGPAELASVKETR